MQTQAWIAIFVTCTVFALLQLRKRAPVEILFLCGMLSVTFAGVLEPKQALAGFATPAVITIGALLVVAAGLRNTGVLDWFGQRLLGTAKSDTGAVWRLAVALVSTSAFLLNTALVVMMVPVVVDWCHRVKVSPSRLLIPVSYFAILGGVCSLIGTSTTLIINTELRSEYRQRIEELASIDPGDPNYERRARFADLVRPMGLFEIGKVGLPCALVGTTVLLLIRGWLLPHRDELIDLLEERQREYLVEMQVRPECKLIGQTVEEAGLRNLDGLFLIEINRESELITPVAPSDVIHEDDYLVFAGVVKTIVELEKIPGLVSTAETSDELHAAPSRRRMAEAVLSRSSPLIGATVRSGNFRERYNAAIVAVHREGERITTKIGDILLQPGDTLLLQTRDDFFERHRNNPDFYLISNVEGYSPRQYDKAWIAASLSLVLVFWLVAGNFEFLSGQLPFLKSPPIAAATIAMAMVLTRCLSVSDARNSVNLQILLTIVGALALGKALQVSGAAAGIAQGIVDFCGTNPWLLLVAVYLLAMMFTEMITNNAVAAILLPLAISVAEKSGHSPRPFVMAVALSASLAFLTPIGYQTNLMVMGPGGYQPRDFLRVGTPVSISVAIAAILLIPQIWAFSF